MLFTPKSPKGDFAKVKIFIVGNKSEHLFADTYFVEMSGSPLQGI
jgi:hypothetical protein